MNSTSRSFHALIRTHHIRSRKKIATLKHAAQVYNVFVLLRTGGSPGMMYVEGKTTTQLQDWIKTVQKLRYLDYQLAARPSEMTLSAVHEDKHSSIEEVTTLKDFANAMQDRGILDWWRAAMGYTRSEVSD